MKYILCLVLLLTSISLAAQRDYSWKDSYPARADAINDWVQYLTVSSGYMGPFALPVPEIFPAEIKSESEASLGYANYQCTKGDATTNAMMSGFYYAFPSRKMAVELTIVPHESYKYSDAMADYYHAKSTSGSCGGDFIINSYIQILNQNARRPDVTLRYTLRTASGGDTDNARYVNAAGYSFDFSVGKDVYTDSDSRVRFYGMYGFYCWQLLNFENAQNDAHLYGIGMLYEWKKFMIKADFGGYDGYRDEKDRPLVLRWRADIPLTDHFLLRSSIEHGVRDFPYTGYMINMVYKFK